MYNARGICARRSELKDPSTFLHLDLCPAVNVMVWTQTGYDGVTGAEWLIFKREDKDAVRNFLNRHFQRNIDVDVDPIHSQRYYFDDDLLKVLEEEEGVSPFRHTQEMGEAVLIPAGCVHQVRTFMALIKNPY